jgi:hypothetical protein
MFSQRQLIYYLRHTETAQPREKPLMLFRQVDERVVLVLAVIVLSLVTGIFFKTNTECCR